MHKILTVAGFALLFAAPAMAQTTGANPYAEQAARILEQRAQLPGGGDEKERSDLDWQLQVVKADAYRAGTPIHLAEIRAELASRTFPGRS